MPRAQRALLLFGGIAAALGSNSDYNYTAEATQLRSDLLAGYQRHVAPSSDRLALHGVDYSQAGTDVEMQLRLFKVEAVSAAEGVMRLKVWLRMAWQDDRLRWDPAHYGGLTYTHFWIDASSTSEVWCPDVQMYNSLTGIAETLDPTYARVEHTGAVFFSRPGKLDVMCKFSTAVPAERPSIARPWSCYHRSRMLHDHIATPTIIAILCRFSHNHRHPMLTLP